VAVKPLTSGWLVRGEHIRRIDVDDVPVMVASLADVIRSKEAANRPKDRAALPVLRRILEQQRRRARNSKRS
jgi:hypothetical protein